MKKRTSILAVAVLSVASFASNAIVIGDSTGSVQTGNIYTFTFDNYTSSPRLSDRFGATMSFTSGDLDLTVTGSGGVYQDIDYIHGGLGVNPKTGLNPGGDNMKGAEWLKFSLGGRSFDVMGWTFNGSHKSNASGKFEYESAAYNGINAGAHLWDGVGTEQGLNGNFADNFAATGTFTDVDWFRLGGDSRIGANSFSGYVESLTIRVSDVPEPSVLALFGLGLLGMGAVARKRKQS